MIAALVALGLLCLWSLMRAAGRAERMAERLEEMRRAG